MTVLRMCNHAAAMLQGTAAAMPDTTPYAQHANMPAHHVLSNPARLHVMLYNAIRTQAGHTVMLAHTLWREQTHCIPAAASGGALRNTTHCVIIQHYV